MFEKIAKKVVTTQVQHLVVLFFDFTSFSILMPDEWSKIIKIASFYVNLGRHKYATSFKSICYEI